MNGSLVDAAVGTAGDKEDNAGTTSAVDALFSYMDGELTAGARLVSFGLFVGSISRRSWVKFSFVILPYPRMISTNKRARNSRFCFYDCLAFQQVGFPTGPRKAWRTTGC